MIIVLHYGCNQETISSKFIAAFIYSPACPMLFCEFWLCVAQVACRQSMWSMNEHMGHGALQGLNTVAVRLGKKDLCMGLAVLWTRTAGPKK